MQLSSFTSEDTPWERPRLGILINEFRLDRERLFELAERPPNSLSWFDQDSKCCQRARETYEKLLADDNALGEAQEKGWLVFGGHELIEFRNFASWCLGARLICSVATHAKSPSRQVPQRQSRAPFEGKTKPCENSSS